MESQEAVTIKTLAHNPAKISLIVSTAVILILTLAFNGLSASPNAGPLFNSNQANLSDKFYLSVTPAGWTFSIWGFIYTFQVLWIGATIYAIFKRGNTGYLYLSPCILPSGLFITYNIANLSNIAWLFAFDNEILPLALVFLASICGFTWATVGIAISALHYNRARLQKEFRWLAALLRLCLVNGVGMYAAWTTVATLLNVAHVMVYTSGKVSESSASTTILSILLVEIIIFVVVDVVVLDSYFRFLWTPYITLVIALLGSVLNGKEDANNVSGTNQPKTTLNRDFSVALLVISSILLFVKIGWTFWREKRRPL